MQATADPLKAKHPRGGGGAVNDTQGAETMALKRWAPPKTRFLVTIAYTADHGTTRRDVVRRVMAMLAKRDPDGLDMTAVRARRRFPGEKV